ncbi:disease resistance protein RPV1-like isoform X2 [Trifolium pratense]|nr:disease resistance protein RPV1-like isoform X2 [Trifolium pratense]
MERLHQWKMALNQAANLSGYHFSSGYEYKFIEEIVKYISNKINRVSLHVADYPVGLHSRVQQVKSLLDKGSNDEVHMVGIYGAGGLGKSTLARAIYNFVGDQFEDICFIHNVRENSTQNNLKHLQEELLLKTVGLDIKLGDVSEGIPIIRERLHRKKILLILDDVDKLKQLQVLAGGFDWFGAGSTVIITTRDKHLLNSHEIKDMYAVEGLYGTEALELLRWMAFKNNKVPSNYEAILNRAVTYASGLPLAIEIVGSNLFRKSIEEWKYTLDGYEKIPNKEIQKILKVSFDALEEEEQSVFLDIACCFNGCRMTEVEEILRAHYGGSMTHRIQVLSEKSLIKIGYFEQSCFCSVTVHDLIKDMGKEIVRQESPKAPEKRSRLWLREDIIQVLEKNTENSDIEIISLNCGSTEATMDWDGKAFEKMKSLVTLIIKSDNFSEGSIRFPCNLRVLKWQKYHSQCIPYSFFNKKFENIKVLKFDNCEYLREISDVSCLPNLENFSFENCENLVTIHNSIGFLNKLEFLNVSGCIKLKSFPPLNLVSLKKLILSHCNSLQSFPEILSKIENIKDIDIRETSIEDFPVSFQNFTELISISISIGGCGMLRLPSFIFKMPKFSSIWVQKIYHNFMSRPISKVCSDVKWVYLYESNLSDECLPIAVTWFTNEEELNLVGSNFEILPECLNERLHLRGLELFNCLSLKKIRGIRLNIVILSATNCRSLNFSSRSMLVNQELLNESREADFYFPAAGSERIPEWFEHQSIGPTRVSFWLRNKIPSIALFFSTKWVCNHEEKLQLRVNLFINGDKYTFSLEEFIYVSLLETNHIYLIYLDLDGLVHCSDIYEKLESKLNEAFLKKEWIHMELKLESYYWKSENDSDEMMKSLRAKFGIHVFKEENNLEDVEFTNPYRKRRSYEHLRLSVST